MVPIEPSRPLLPDELAEAPGRELAAVVRVDDDPGPACGTSLAMTSGVVDQRGLAASVDRPAHDLSAKGVEHTAAVDLALGRRVLGDVGEPQHVGLVDHKIALHEVLFGGGVHQVLLVLLWARQARGSRARA